MPAAQQHRLKYHTARAQDTFTLLWLNESMNEWCISKCALKGTNITLGVLEINLQPSAH